VQCTFCKQKIQLYKLQAHKRMCGLRHRWMFLRTWTFAYYY
jgi:hypothetical protein